MKNRQTNSADALFREYRETGNREIRNEIIIKYAHVVKIIAGRLKMYFGNNVEYDELVSYGTFGLIDAVDKFDIDKDVKFETYAGLRIKGAIIDAIRKLDIVKRTTREKEKAIKRAMEKLSADASGDVQTGDIARELGISEDELCEWQTEILAGQYVYIDENPNSDAIMKQAVNSSAPVTPEQAALRGELKEKLMECLDQLSEKERKIVLLYYYEELSLREIADVFGITQSRVSQLHARALNKLGKILGDYMAVFPIQVFS